MSSGKNTRFNVEWTDAELNPEWSKWVKPIRDEPFKAVCGVCSKTINLSNMGKSALTSHSESVAHKKNVEAQSKLLKGQSSVRSFFQPSTSSSGASDTREDDLTSNQVARRPTDTNTSSNRVNKSADDVFQRFKLKTEVTKAEILFALRLVKTHMSYNSCSDLQEFLHTCFPDSEIANRMTLGATKAAYLVCHGLAPYIKNQLISELEKVKDIVVLFDESLNEVVQKGQMDLNVRFWSSEKNRVQQRYLTSVFLGHASAPDLLGAFKSGLTDSILGKLFQVSMDGPNVNLKFLDDLQSDPIFSEENSLVDIGVCGLHVIHGSFQTGHKAAGWNVNSVLSSMYRLFKDSPARRADYIRMNGKKVFPLKFCSTRWVENQKVAARAIETYHCVEKFVKNSKLPETYTARTLKAAMEDPMTLPRIAFFQSIAALIEPFLTVFQSPAPLAPFLFDELRKLIEMIMKRFIKSSALDEANSVSKLMTLPLEENKVSYKNVDIGVKASQLLRKSAASDKVKLEFRMECIAFLMAMTEKIRQRSPLKYGLTRMISSIAPTNIVEKAGTASRRYSELVEHLHSHGKLTMTVADRSKLEFETLLKEAKSRRRIDKFSNFSITKDRLDDFYVDLLDGREDMENLFEVIKTVLIMSHGQAQVESGFSINTDILIENMRDESVIAQRIVYDYIQYCGGVLKVCISPGLISSARSSHATYLEDLRRRKNEVTEEQRQQAEKRKNELRLKELKAKKARLADEARKEQDKLNSEIERLQTS